MMKTTTKKTARSRMVRIWTRAYRPFILGGDVHAPICTTVMGKPVDLGRGFKGYIVRTPGNYVVIAEATSGGIVGHVLASVQCDIATAPLSMMRKQVREAVIAGKHADPVKPEEFWRLMGKK